MAVPKISIITPSFNQGLFLEKTILSVLGQQYPNLEYVIVDGGSTDNSVEIIKKYQSSLSWWVSEKDRGQSHALNKGYAKVTGDIIAWINSDDWYEPGVFQTIAAAFTGSDHNVVLGNCIIHTAGLSETTVVRPKKTSERTMLRYWNPEFCPPQPSIFFRSRAIRTQTLVDEKLRYAMDLDLWLRLASQGAFHYVDQTFSNYLIHQLSKSGSDNGFEKFAPEWKMVCRNHVRNSPILVKAGFYWDLVMLKIKRKSGLH